MNHKEEIWVDIIDYEGLYQVSDLGNVKSIKNGRNNLLKPYLGKRGYYTLNLSKNNVIKNKPLHRLVWESFNGKTELDVDHIIEGNKLDNRLCNLQAVTRRKNVSKYYSTVGTKSKYAGVTKNRFSMWVANIFFNKKLKYIGTFKTEIDAHNAYQKQLLTINQAK